MTQANDADQLEREKDAFFDPDTTSITDGTTQRLLQLADEIKHLRAAGQHWKERAVKAETRVDELQRRLNDELASKSAAAVSRNGKAETAAEAKPS